MCSGHSISGRSNATGVLWSEIPSKMGNNLWIESLRTDAGGVMRLPSSQFWLTTMWYERFQQKGRGLLYCTSSADGINIKWNVIDIDHWVKKVFNSSKMFKDCCHHCPFAVSGQGRWWQWHKPGNSMTSVAVQRKLQKAGGLVGKKGNGNSLAKHVVTLPGVASACAWNILPELLDQIWPEQSRDI